LCVSGALSVGALSVAVAHCVSVAHCASSVGAL
jgi:hypothetical protein